MGEPCKTISWEFKIPLNAFKYLMRAGFIILLEGFRYMSEILSTALVELWRLKTTYRKVDRSRIVLMEELHWPGSIQLQGAPREDRCSQVGLQELQLGEIFHQNHPETTGFSFQQIFSLNSKKRIFRGKVSRPNRGGANFVQFSFFLNFLKWVILFIIYSPVPNHPIYWIFIHI